MKSRRPSRPLLGLALLLAGTALPGRAAPAELEIRSGRATWLPGGVGPPRPAAGKVSLYPGDVIEVAPGADATLLVGTGPARPLAAPGTFRVDAAGFTPLDAVPEAGPPSTDDTDLFASLRPVGGSVWIRTRDEERWVEARGRASLRPGTEIRVGPEARAEVSARGSYVARLQGGAQVSLLRRTVHVLSGRGALEVEKTGAPFVVTTPDARARGGGGLLVVEHSEDGGTILEGLRGLWRVENRPPDPEEPTTLYLPPGKHTRVASPRDAPAPPLRFDADTALQHFTENWDQDRAPPPPVLQETTEDDAALRHLREDQVPKAVEAPAPTHRDAAEPAPKPGDRPRLSARDRKKWLRLRLLSARSPHLRRRYLAFRRAYADDRAHALPPGEKERARGYTEGADDRTVDEQDAWLQARHQQRIRQREVELRNEDRQRRDMAHLEKERFLRESREEFFSYEPLKYQTRAMLGPTRARVDTVVAEAARLDQQVRGLAGTPGFEAQLRELAARRDALLREADRRKDQLEELIELH